MLALCLYQRESKGWQCMVRYMHNSHLTLQVQAPSIAIVPHSTRHSNCVHEQHLACLHTFDWDEKYFMGWKIDYAQYMQCYCWWSPSDVMDIISETILHKCFEQFKTIGWSLIFAICLGCYKIRLGMFPAPRRIAMIRRNGEDQLEIRHSVTGALRPLFFALFSPLCLQLRSIYN